jgi:hypothetical protein
MRPAREVPMKRFSIPRPAAAAVILVFFLAAACATAPAGGGGERASQNPPADLAGMLSGRFEGATPGNGLTLNIQSVATRSLSHPYDLFLEVFGKYQDTNVHQEGYLHLSPQGRDVFVGYIPHFDPSVGSLSPGATRFSATEAQAACSLYFAPQGDGFVGEAGGTNTCALAMRGATGKWEIRVEPGSIAVRNEASGETLRFRRVGRS